MALLFDNTTPIMEKVNVTNETVINTINDLANAVQTYIIVFLGLILNVIAVIAWTKPGCVPRRRTCPTIIRSALVWVDLLSISGYILRGCFTPVLKNISYDLFCDVFGFMNVLFPLTSGLVAAIMSVDRYAALSSPFTYAARFNPKRITIGILLLIVVSTFVGSLPFLGIGTYHKIDHFHGKTVCKLAWYPDEPPLYQLHFVLYQVVGWFLLLSVLVCNAGVIRTLLSMRKRLSASGSSPHSAETWQEVRFARTMMLVTLFFSMCWVPWMITIILIKIGAQTTIQGDLLATRLLLANSAFDPLIFMITSETFCSRLRKAIAWAAFRLGCPKRTTCEQQLNAAFVHTESGFHTGPFSGSGGNLHTVTSSLPSYGQSFSVNPIIIVSDALGNTELRGSRDTGLGDETTDIAVVGESSQEFTASTENLVSNSAFLDGKVET